MAERAWVFVRNAGTVILAISIVLWFLGAYPRRLRARRPQQALAQTLRRTGRACARALTSPSLRLADRHRLISSFAAREVFVSSTAVVFSVDQSGSDKAGGIAPLRNELRNARAGPTAGICSHPLVC